MKNESKTNPKVTPKKFYRAWLEAPKKLRFQEISLEFDKLKDKEIFAETEFSGISIGTEVAAYEGKEPLRPGQAYPRLLGYSNIAKVVLVGKKVKTLKPGDRIFTHQSHQNAFIVDHDKVLAVVPKSLPLPVASLAYIAHIALTGLQRTQLKKGEVIAVLGLGPIGLSAIALAKLKGAKVIALGNDAGRLKKAKELGADLCLQSNDTNCFLNIVEEIKKKFGRQDIDLMVSTINSWDGWLLSLKLLRFGGRIAVLGFPGRGEGLPTFNPLATEYTYVKQLRIYHCGLSQQPPGEEKIQLDVKTNMKMLLSLIKKDALPLGKMLTHKFRWNELEQVYGMAMERNKSLIAAVLDWTDDWTGK